MSKLSFEHWYVLSVFLFCILLMFVIEYTLEIRGIFVQIKELLTCVYDYLPENVIDDIVFNGLWDDILGEVKDASFIVGTVGLRADIYNRVVEDYPQFVKSLSVKNDKMLSFMIVSGRAITFKIYNSEDFLDISIQENDYNKESNTIYVRHFDLGRIELNSSKLDDEGYFVDYTCDIKYIDEEGNEVIVDGVEEEKDEIFAQKFHVPMVMARVFRTNFKIFSKEISRMKAKTEMVSCDEDMSDEDKYLFSKPFLFKDLKELIISDTQKRIYEDLQELGIDAPDTYMVQKPQAIDAIVQNLVNQIGGESEVVISDNIIQNFYFVLENVVSNEILTNGMIIKKADGEFILYLVQIENDRVSLIPQVLGEEQREMLFNKSAKNMEVEGLREFLELGLKR